MPGQLSETPGRTNYQLFSYQLLIILGTGACFGETIWLGAEHRGMEGIPLLE